MKSLCDSAIEETTLTIEKEGAALILRDIDRAHEGVIFDSLDGTQAKMQKTYRRPSFKFVYKGRAHQVREKRFENLDNACNRILAGVARNADQASGSSPTLGSPVRRT